MKIFFFRHGEKSINNLKFPNNPPLSPRGEDQAKNLVKWVEQHPAEKPSFLATSPLIRTQQSFEPLSTALSLPIHIWKELEDHKEEEPQVQYLERIQKGLSLILNESQHTVYICSHYDWLLDVINFIPSLDVNLSSKISTWEPFQFAGFEVNKNGLWQLSQKGLI